MNITLYLTKECNLACDYCFEKHEEGKSLSPKTAFATVDFLLSTKDDANGICFFGGEPLLQKELLYEIVAYANQKKGVSSRAFAYRVTTNGTLLDTEFLDFSQKENILIALSHDGVSHDKNRRFPNGALSETLVSEKAKLLLSYQPKTVAMCTISPETVQCFPQSVDFLRKLGFCNILTSIDRRPNAGWTQQHFASLKEGYEIVAKDYVDAFGTTNSFSYYNFEQKIRTHIQGKSYCGMQCKLGKRQPVVFTDGTIYPCIQFVDAAEYAMGSVFDGIICSKQNQLFKQSQKPIKSCRGCALQSRCQYHCSCLNYQQTGNMNTVSAEQCMHEQIIIPVSDQIANQLYLKNPNVFKKKFYGTDLFFY